MPNVITGRQTLTQKSDMKRKLEVAGTTSGLRRIGEDFSVREISESWPKLVNFSNESGGTKLWQATEIQKTGVNASVSRLKTLIHSSVCEVKSNKNGGVSVNKLGLRGRELGWPTERPEESEREKESERESCRGRAPSLPLPLSSKEPHQQQACGKES